MLRSITTCDRCAWRSDCGGRPDGQQSLFGCFEPCQTPGQCEGLACPCQGDRFIRLLRDVGGLGSRPWKPIRGPELELPLYVPLLRHGKKRERLFDRPIVGVSIRDLLPRRRPQNYHPVVASAARLRDWCRVPRKTRIIVSSVAPDQPIEDFWSFRNVTGVIQQLAELDLAAMTTPNYSFFTNVPRTHTLYARKRIVLAAEELSAAGIPAILHVNAETDFDWDFWFDVLSGFPAIRHVAKEFQTGNRRLDFGLRALHELDRLQQRLGRHLHPVAVGGAQYAMFFAQRFETFTIMDSHPFMTASHRRELMWRGPRLMKVRRRAATTDDLLERNEGRYALMLELQRRTGMQRRRRLPLAGAPGQGRRVTSEGILPPSQPTI